MAISADFIFKVTIENVAYHNSELVMLINSSTGEREVDEDMDSTYRDGSNITYFAQQGVQIS